MEINRNVLINTQQLLLEKNKIRGGTPEWLSEPLLSARIMILGSWNRAPQDSVLSRE